MGKSKKSETAPEQVLEENEVVEQNTETAEETISDSIQLEKVDSAENKESSIEEIQDESVVVPEEEDSLEESQDPSQDAAEESIDINDGAEVNVGQDSLNNIPVDFEDVSSDYAEETNSIYVDVDIKLQNILVNLEEIQENDISFTKNEDLSVAITYVSEALKAVGKLRK